MNKDISLLKWVNPVFGFYLSVSIFVHFIYTRICFIKSVLKELITPLVFNEEKE